MRTLNTQRWGFIWTTDRTVKRVIFSNLIDKEINGSVVKNGNWGMIFKGKKWAKCQSQQRNRGTNEGISNEAY